MSKSDSRFELMKTLKQRQDKFVYYLLGLNVAAIGFSLSKTFDDKLNDNHLYLGFALLCWFISIMFSMRWIYLQLAFMQHNLDLADWLDGFYDKEKISEKQKSAEILDLKTKLIKGSKVIDQYFQGMIYAFLVGIGDFIIWRIVEMW